MRMTLGSLSPKLLTTHHGGLQVSSILGVRPPPSLSCSAVEIGMQLLLGSARSSPTWSPHRASCMAPSTPSPLSRTLVSWCCQWLPPATPRYCPALGPEAAPSPSALALALWPWTYIGSLPSGTTCSFLMGLPGSSWTSRVICALNFPPNRPVVPQSRSCLAPWFLLPQHPQM